MVIFSRLSLSLFFVLLSLRMLAQPCPTLGTATVSTATACVGDQITVSVQPGTNLTPGTQTVDWYLDSGPGFSPPGQGTFIGSSAITGGGAGPCGGGAPGASPLVLGANLNPCNSSNPASPNGSEENEFLILWSGGGFNANALGIDVANGSTAAPSTADIGTFGSCGLTGGGPAVGGCVVVGDPNGFVPPNAFVLVFTSSLADRIVDFSALCALGFPVYTFINTCDRIIPGTNNVQGAFNNGGGAYQVDFGCSTGILNYNSPPSNSNTLDVFSIAGIPFQVPCGTFPSFATAPPVVPTTIAIDPLNYVIDISDCGQQYIRGVVQPPVPGCPDEITAALPVQVQCPSAVISGTGTICEGDNPNLIEVLFTGQSTGPYNYTFSDGTTATSVNATSNPSYIDVSGYPPGTYTFSLNGITTGCPGTWNGTASLTVTSAAPLTLSTATICASDQPYDLTQLEDPSSPGGTWSGTGVSNPGPLAPTFNAGPAASGIFTLTYTPTSGCSGTPTTTLNIVGGGTAAPLNGTACILDLPYDLTPLEDPAAPGGTWSGPGVSGNVFVGTGAFPAPGNYPLTYTPPGGGGACSGPGTSTLTVTSTLPFSIASIPPQCAGQAFDVRPFISPASLTGVWTGTYVTGPGVVDPPAGFTGLATLDLAPTGCYSPISVGVNFTNGQPAAPLDATICSTEQPYDLTLLEDPAAPGGTWSGNWVTGNTFDAGPGASGPFVVSYTPPAGSGCSSPGQSTITVNLAGPVAVNIPPSVCAGQAVDLNTLLVDPTITGTWTGTWITGSIFQTNAGGSGSYLITFTPDPGPCNDITQFTLNVVLASAVSPLAIPTICASDQPVDLTPYEDPAFPGGAWMSPFVTGSLFDAGPTASGNYNLSYSPPAGSGCFSSGTTSITIDQGPTPTLAPLNVCESDGLVTLVPDPAYPTGTFAGSFVLAPNLFDATSAGPGSYTYTYTPTSAPGVCVGTATGVIVVRAGIPTAPATISVCEGQTVNVQSLLPPGRPPINFTGTHMVNATTFSPPLGSGGTSVVLTGVVDPAGAPGACFAPIIVTVNISPSVAVAVSDANLCSSAAPLDLNTLIASPIPAPAGTWSGTTGVTGNFFDPAGLPSQSYIVTFTPTGPGSCASPVSAMVTVASSVTPVLQPIDICDSDLPVLLSAYEDPLYPGGVWTETLSGTVVTQLDNLAADGVELTYTPAAGGCALATTLTPTLTVSQTPTFAPPLSLCAGDGPTSLIGLQTNAALTGTWSGPGVSGTTLDPAIGGVGPRTLTFTPNEACAPIGTTSVTVDASGTVALDATTLCETDPIYALSQLLIPPTAAAGTWSGAGVVAGTDFDPSSGSGTYTLTFTPTNACIAPATTIVTVSAQTQAGVQDANLCAASGVISLNTLLPAGSTAMGTWTIGGVATATFDPAIGNGTYEAIFTETGSACALPDTALLTVAASVTPNISPISACAADLPLPLTSFEDPVYPGGQWLLASDRSVLTQLNFAAGTTTDVVYVPPSGGCAIEVTVQVTVTANETPVLTNATVCNGDPAFALSTLFSGAAYAGTWSGAGLSGGTDFDPALVTSGDYTIQFTASDPCVANASVQITVSDLTNVTLTLDSTCAAAGPIDLSLLTTPAGVAGTWSGPNVTPAGVYTPASFSGSSTVTFTPTAACFTAAQYTFDVVDVSPLMASAPTFDCAPDGLTYTATLTVSAAGNNGTITTSLGTLSGGVLMISGLLSGGSPEVILNDQATCTPALTIPLGNSCQPPTCDTDAGSLSGGPFELCPGATLQDNAASGTNLEPGDVLIYILDDDTDPTNGFIASGPSTQFTDPGGVADQQLNVYAYAGDDDGSGNVDPADNCATTSNSVSVRWASNIGLSVGFTCEPDGLSYRVTVSGIGGLSPYTFNTGTATGTTDPTGTSWTSDLLPTTFSFSVTATSLSGCTSAPTPVTANCPPPGCTLPDPGTFAAPTFSICDATPTTLNYNNDASLNPGQVFSFVVFSDASLTTEVLRSPTLPLDLVSLGISPLYVVAAAGEDDGSGGIDPACAAVSPAVEVVLGTSFVLPPLDTTICATASFTLGDMTFDASNTSGTATFPGAPGECDSTRVVTVTVLNGGVVVERRDTLCAGETIIIARTLFSEAFPTGRIPLGSGPCDTVIDVSLTFRDSIIFDLNATACATGDPIFIGSTRITPDNPTATVVLQAANGCDSIVNASYTFVDGPTLSLSGDQRLCSPDDYVFDVTVDGTRELTATLNFGGADAGTVTLPPGTTTLTYPVNSGGQVTLRNILASSGGCAQASPSSLTYQPQVSFLQPEITTPFAAGFIACGDNTIATVGVNPGQGIPPYSFNWTTGDTTSSLSNVGRGVYGVTLTDGFGCVASDTVEVVDADVIDYEASVVDPLCDEGRGSISISLDDVPPGLQFRFDLPGLSPVTSADFVFDSLAEGSYVFQLIQDNGCAQDEIFVLVDPLGSNLIKEDSITIRLGDSARLSVALPEPDALMQWVPGDFLRCDTCATTYASPPRDLLYTAVVQTSDDCVIEDQVFIEVLPVREIFIPSGFSPNEDGRNDLLIPFAGPEVELIEEFMIFDRWGTMVFSRNDLLPGEQRNGWNGTHRGRELDPAVFVAFARVRFIDGDVRTFTQDVTLVR